VQDNRMQIIMQVRVLLLYFDRVELSETLMDWCAVEGNIKVPFVLF